MSAVVCTFTLFSLNVFSTFCIKKIGYFNANKEEIILRINEESKKCIANIL